jgi:hypothetical protein
MLRLGMMIDHEPRKKIWLRIRQTSTSTDIVMLLPEIFNEVEP